MLRNDKDKLVSKLYNEVQPKHAQYNGSIHVSITKAREQAIANASTDFKELVKLIEEKGYKTLVRQCIQQMAFATEGVPQKISEGYPLQDEIRKMLEEIDDRNKTDKQVEEELKQKIVDKYKILK